MSTGEKLEDGETVDKNYKAIELRKAAVTDKFESHLVAVSTDIPATEIFDIELDIVNDLLWEDTLSTPFTF